MNGLQRLIGFGSKASSGRKSLSIATIEGLQAIGIFYLLSNPFQTGFLLYMGASSFQIGIVMAIPGLANIIQVWAAFWIQKFNNRRTPLVILATLHRVLWVSTGLIPFIFPKELWVEVYIVLFLSAFMSNAAGSVFFSSLIADMVPVQVRGRYFGIRSMLMTALGSAWLFVGGQILDRFPGIQGFNILFLICVVLTVTNLILLCLYPNVPFEKSKEQDKMKMFMLPFQDRPFLKAMLFISLFVFLQGIAVPLFSFVMLNIMDISYKWVSIVTMVQTIVMMISYYLWGVLNSKFSTRILLMWSLPIVALSCFVWVGLSILPALLVLFAVHILLGIGFGGFNLLTFNFMIGDTPKDDRPMYVAVYSAVTGLMGFVGPVLGGIVYKEISDLPIWVQSYGVSGGVGVILLVLTIVFGPIVFKDRSEHAQRVQQHKGIGA